MEFEMRKPHDERAIEIESKRNSKNEITKNHKRIQFHNNNLTQHWPQTFHHQMLLVLLYGVQNSKSIFNESFSKNAWQRKVENIFLANTCFTVKRSCPVAIDNFGHFDRWSWWSTISNRFRGHWTLFYNCDQWSVTRKPVFVLILWN